MVPGGSIDGGKTDDFTEYLNIGIHIFLTSKFFLPETRPILPSHLQINHAHAHYDYDTTIDDDIMKVVLLHHPSSLVPSAKSTDDRSMGRRAAF